MGNTNSIVVGGIMPFLPGLALTNSFRDTMAGDLVSGGARLGETMVRAAALAFGAGAGFGGAVRLTEGSRSFPGKAGGLEIQDWRGLGMELVQAFVFSFAATLLFGVGMYAPRRSLLLGALFGALGYGVYLWLSPLLGEMGAMFFGTLAVSLSGEIAARCSGFPALCSSSRGCPSGARGGPLQISHLCGGDTLRPCPSG